MPSLAFKIVLASVAGVGFLASALSTVTRWKARRAEKAVPADGAFVAVTGGTLHYVDIGEGPPLVLIHGLGGQLRNFTYGLSEKLANTHRLIIVDRPGSGYSLYNRGAPTGLVVQAEMIAELIAKLDLGRPWIVGHSLGGTIALALARDHSDSVGGLALLAPLTQPPVQVTPTFAPLAIKSALVRSILAWFLATPLSMLDRGPSEAELFGPEKAPADFATRGGAALTLRPTALEAASADFRASQVELPAIAAHYGDIKMPVRILFGRGDRILDSTIHGSRAASLFLDGNVDLVEGGHMFPVTQPELTARWIDRQCSKEPTNRSESSLPTSEILDG